MPKKKLGLRRKVIVADKKGKCVQKNGGQEAKKIFKAPAMFTLPQGL